MIILWPASVLAQDFYTLKGHGGPIMDIAVSPSDQIATASFDNSVGLWSGSDPTWLETHTAAVNAIAFVDNNHAVSAGDDFSVVFWNLGTPTDAGTEIITHQGKVTALAVSATHIASASWDGSVGLWDRTKNTTTFLQGHDQGVNDVAFSADGKTLYSASVDGTIRVWDVTSATQSHQLVNHGFGVNELALNEVAGWLAYGAVDGVTRLIDIQTGVHVADYTLERRPILALAYHPQTHQLAVGDGEGYIMIIDTVAQKITRDFRATQRGPIWALAFSLDGQNIHAGSIEDILYSWPIATMDEHDRMKPTKRSFQEGPETMSNGERQFKRKCSICHTLTPSSARKAGPSLHNLFGRQAGTVDDYSYSETLTVSDIIWTSETIDALFDEGPDHYIPGTKMPMQRITKSQDRTDLITYLNAATSGTGGN